MATVNDIHDSSLSGSELSELDSSVSDTSIVDVAVMIHEDGQERVMVSTPEVRKPAYSLKHGRLKFRRSLFLGLKTVLINFCVGPRSKSTGE